jgi:predicted phage terminase large subunit-like protein
MQRLSERDTAGVILDMGLPYEHLCIPMRYERGRTQAVSTIGYSDPRRVDGELMFPERFPEEQVAELERTLGSYGAAGQLQQRPAPRGGGMFKREWFEIIPAAPANCRWVRGWDLAATDSSEAAYTAGVLMGRTPGGEYIIADATRIQGAPASVERLIVNTAQQDGTQVAGSIPQDPGQAGKSQALYLIRQLAGFTYRASPESGDKETRAQPLSAQAEVGNVKLVAGAWNREFLDELSTFPVGKFKDQVDAASRAFSELVRAEPTRTIKVVR